ncbi:MAG: hypothetical protein SF123_22895 [Chloroflexota bacterium]|nr:hypothetical protein [Chloroflexota bacterium]
MIYGAEGTQALFTGLATQVIYGGCECGHGGVLQQGERYSDGLPPV